ncbi:hypothetical protein PUN28_010784 [Cardiocondyla obscurior]|uniref:VWFC domain-containing protein n=2 Tax=Cardiocondyla obscurior TaxID=286306 RepID=A0AAW2FL31_9HYME
MSALNAALCRRGIILWLAAVLLLASRSTHSAPVYDQDTTQIAEYDGVPTGCYFNYQRYQEGDRIMTSEPCLNCTCHNRMLMCYLKVCPFTKAIGQDCTVEKRPDQCCPVITCPEVPVQLLTSTTSAPATSDSTEVGFHDNYGCHVDERFYADGAMLPLDHHNPCELCYCIRNRTTCVMQECTLRVAGCKPVYQSGVCCPIKYNCEYDEESSTTVGPTPGLIMTTTLPPGVLAQCYHEGKVYEDGDLIYSTQPCQHCYCFRGEIACAVQNCGSPMQEHGKNCTALAPPEGECCPTTYQCDEETTTIQAEEQFSEQVPQGQITEFPLLIDQEDQQEKGEHPQEEIFPGIDNNIPQAAEDENVQGTIEHITQGHIPFTGEPEEQPATPPTEEIETTTIEKQSTSSQEHVTEISPEISSEEAEVTKESSEIETVPTTVQGAEENLVTEVPAAELPEISSITEGLKPEEEISTTKYVPEEHVSTEEDIIEKEQSTSTTAEKEQPIEPSISETGQTEGSIKEEEEATSPYEELSTQKQEEITKVEKTTEEEISVTKLPATLATEEPSISTVSESISEQPKEDENKSETIPGEFLATQTELPKDETVTTAHETSSTEQITEKEISHSTETAVTEGIQSPETSGPSKEQPIEEQKPVLSQEEEKQRPEEASEEHATVGAKKEDAGLTERIGEESITTEKSSAEEESTPELPIRGPTGIPIPERSPEQKAEDENVYHVTEDYSDITHSIISPHNLITESPQKTPTTYVPQEQETTLASSEETAKPISTEGNEVSTEGTTPTFEQATEIILPTQRKPESTTVIEEIKTESTPAVTEVSTKSSPTTIAQEVPEEISTKVPQTEKIPSGEEITTKVFNIEESSESPSEKVSGEKEEKEIQPKKEEEIETQSPFATKSTPETSTFISAEHSTIPLDLEKEHATEDEHITTVIPSEQSTHVPTQVEEKETEIVPVEKEAPITEKPVEERVTEHPIATPSIIGEKEKELQTEKPVLKDEQTTEAITTVKAEEELTTPVIEEKITEQPEYSTKKTEEEAVTESHGPEETEYTKGTSTESLEQQTAIITTEKEPSEELKPTEFTSIEQTELPVKHLTEPSKIDKEDEDTISVPVATEKVQTEIPVVKTETTEITSVEIEKTEPSVGGEYIPSQPSIPSDRKEDQESIEPEINEGQITQKPETELIETEEPQTISSVGETSLTPSLEGAITESVTPEQPKISSEQPEKVTTKPPAEEEQTQESITEKQLEIHEKETETSTSTIHEEPSITPEISKQPIEENVKVDSTTESAESTTILISEASTELPGFEESTKHEIPIEKEITPATETTTEKEQPEIQEQATQPSIKTETSSTEKETERPSDISTEKDIIFETTQIPTIEEQPQKPEEEKEIIQKAGFTETPVHEEKEEYSTVSSQETSKVTISTEIPQYTTSVLSIEESTSEITPRPSGIPGEGNCLVEGQSYGNNSAVPPANACQTSCRCISSIVQCELVQCPAPPENLANCMPVRTSGESCCSTYACDSTPTDLESESHVIEPHIPGAEEESQKTVPPVEISTEAVTESSTLAVEITTPGPRPVESTVTPFEEEIATEKQQTTLKPIEIINEEQTTVKQFVEEYTISPTSKTTQESVSEIPEEEHTVPEKTTESKISEEGITELISTEQPQKEIDEKQVTISGEVITSTHIPVKQEPHSTEETITSPTTTQEKETSVEIEKVTISTEKEDVTTIAIDKETIVTSTEKQEKPTDETGIEEQSTLKPLEIEKEQPQEEKILPTSTSEEPITLKEHETFTTPQEISEEQKTVQPTEYESTSIPEIESTIKYKLENETEYKEEKEQETETAQTEEPESHTKLPDITSTETQTRIIPVVELTSLSPDHTISEGVPTEKYTTIKSVEESTKTEPEISTQAPVFEEEHITNSIETELPGGETTKLIEESTSEIPHKEILPETTESAIEKETTENIEKQTELPFTEHKEEPSVTKSPDEPLETESPVSTEAEGEHEKPIESTTAHELESTQVSVEEHSEVTLKIDSQTSQLPTEAYTVAEEVSTSTPETKISEQSTTSIIKEIEPSLSETETKQPVIPESQTPETTEPVTAPIEEQTPKSEESPAEEHTAASSTSSEENVTEIGVSTEAIPVTSQEEQTTEKSIESLEPETQLPEQYTITPEIPEKEEQKPEIEITEEPGKEEQTTLSVKKETPAITTTEYNKETIEPVEITTVSKEQKPEKDGQVTEALPEHPVSEEATTVESSTPKEYSIIPEIGEKESTDKPEYQTTSSTIEEASKPATEISEIEKLSPEKGIVTTESTEEKSEEPVTEIEISLTEKPVEIPSETEKPIEQETEQPEIEQGETSTKLTESTVTKETLPEETVPKIEEKPTEISTTEEEEAQFTEPTYSVETSSVHEEEQPSIIKLQPTDGPLSSTEETAAGEIQPSQPEESEEAHSTTPEESHLNVTEEPQLTTEHAFKESTTKETEIESETYSEVAVTEGPIKFSSITPTELPEKAATESASEESESQFTTKSEDIPQPETPVEEPIIKTQPLPTESLSGEITEKTPEEEFIPQEGEGHPHIDRFPQTTLKPEIDFNFQRPATTLAPHIPDYPDQSGISGEDTHFPGGSYPNPDDDYGEEDYGGPGTCRYGGKVYVSAQQIPRDDPCDFCFCFRSDIICLQQSCPPPIPGCHEEPISGFCCPRYECPVSMATALNLTTTTTTTTTTLPPHFHAHAYKGAARRSGCQVRGMAYRVGEVIQSASGPCLRCICGGDGNMNCDPRVCTPEPMLRQMIAATTDTKRRR